MAYFPHAYQKMLVASANTPFLSGNGTTTNFSNLAAGQVAIMDAKTNLAVNLSSSPTYAGLPMAYLAQGSFHAYDKLGSSLHGGYKETVKSKGINPKYVSSFYYVSDKDPINHELMVKPGTDCTNITCDTTYHLRIDVKGSPALRFLTHNLYQTVDAYSGCCDSKDSNIDPMVLLLQWKERINESLILNQFVQASVFNKVANAGTTTAADAIDTTTTTATFDLTSYTNIAVGHRVVGQDIPVGSVITEVNGTTSITITFPELAAEPAVGDFNAMSGLIFYAPVTTPFDEYTPETGETDPDTNDCFLVLTGAYTNTNFLDCSFSPMDHVEYQPIEIYASVVEQTNIPCDTACFGRGGVVTAPEVSTITTGGIYILKQAKQGSGFGETIIRELILSNRYRQEPFQQDQRLREVLDDTTFNSGIVRGNRYGAYYILHSVPRKSNPSGTLDADQYLIKIPVSARSTGAGSFESFMNAWLASAGSEVSCQVL